MSREDFDAIREHAKQSHKERVAKNGDRLEFACRMLDKHSVEYSVKNEATGHIHARRKSDDKLCQFYAGTGKIMESEKRGIHNFIKIVDDLED